MLVEQVRTPFMTLNSIEDAVSYVGVVLEQVLRLVHYLVAYGFYGNIGDIKQLLGPLISLADGRNDKQYPLDASSKDMEEVLHRYRTQVRYKKSRETQAIVDAKAQYVTCLHVTCV